MTDYLTEYKKYISGCLDNENCDLKQLLDYHKDKIEQFQHERLIHLLVTILFAVCTVITLTAIAIWQTIILAPLGILLLVLLIPYIKHYYFLENSVQSLYKDYDAIYSKLYRISQKGENNG